MTKTKSEAVEITPADNSGANAASANPIVYHTDSFWTSSQTNLISAAMVKFHSENLMVAKQGEATITANVKRKYVKLDDIMSAVRPVLAKYECYIEQHLAGDSVLTRLVHSSGQFIASKFHYQTWESQHTNNLQRLGGGLSYLKRYAASAILNIVADEDADGDGTDNVGYKPTGSNKTTTSNNVTQSTNANDNREWLNLKTKDGQMTSKGEAAIKFIREGGALESILAKYKVNKADKEHLQQIVQQLKAADVPDNAYDYFDNDNHELPY